ncbi:MAG: hypothetical protein H0X26_00730 [Alphaproteobacteria bacterium]|nr:hypothetical protein [Alphaproteobacteria bacterium]
MKKMLFTAAPFFVLGALWVAPLYAMEVEGEKKGSKASTLQNRQARDDFLKAGDYFKAAPFAQKVINETPDAEDNEDATIEDFRIARDIYRCLAQNDPVYYLEDAGAYADGVNEFKEVTQEDFIQARDIHLENMFYEQVDYYNTILIPQHVEMSSPE